MRLTYALMIVATLFSFGCSSQIDNTQLVNREASLPSSFQFEAKGLNKVISSSINRKKATMSTLYGNDQAFQYAHTHADSSYPNGAVLALVTWKQQEDPRWFGANIPGELQSIELVKINGTNTTYEQFTGTALTPAANSDTALITKRTRYILDEKPAVTP
ncbi:MAG TPA: cytochrome P460 family protein [Chitinophaga sp.]